jgi:hypothetical protein
MTERLAASASLASRGTKQYIIRKQLNRTSHGFALPSMKVIKKSNALAERFTVRRNLNSNAARTCRPFKCSQRVSSKISVWPDKCSPAMECESYDFSRESLIPQVQWDELFESAFEAIGDSPVDLFNDQ